MVAGDFVAHNSSLLHSVYRIFVALVLAQRNVLRHRRRSAFALAANVFGVTALMLAGGFIEWNFMHYREAMIKSHLGHIRIHKAGYTENGSSKPFAYLLRDSASAASALAALPGLVRIAPRLSLSGLLSHGESTLPFIAEGVDPAAETDLSQSLVITHGAPSAPPGGQRLISASPLDMASA